MPEKAPLAVAQHWWFSVHTKIGPVDVAIAHAGVVRIKLPERLHGKEQTHSHAVPPPPKILETLSVVSGALESAHARTSNPNYLPLVFSGTRFQNQIWRAIATLKPGETATYGALAEKVGRPGAARAVGSACGANPFPILIPCHRVVAVGGIGGFSGDLAIKSALLALEESL